MKISIIALNISGAEEVQSAADWLKEQLLDYGECDFVPCDEMQQVSAALNQAFAKSKLIAVGIEPSAYVKTKLAVLRAMHIKTEIDPGLAEQLSTDSELDSKHVAMHAAMPIGAVVFRSENGLCSGFAIRSGEQTLIMLPLEKETAQAMLENSVEPYFQENGIEKAPKPEPAEEKQPAVDLAQIQLLRELNKKVYFASAPAMARFRALYGSGNEDVFVFDSYKAERNGESPKSYLADLARYAIPMEETNAFGAAISNVFTGMSRSGEQRYNVYIALSDGSSSRVIRFLSKPGETPEQLMEAAYDMLLEMIEEKCRDELANADSRTGNEIPAEAIERETPAQHKARKQNGVAAIAFAVMAILIALAATLLLWGMNKAKTDSEEAKQVLASNAAQRAEETTEQWELAELFPDSAESEEPVEENAEIS